MSEIAKNNQTASQIDSQTLEIAVEALVFASEDIIHADEMATTIGKVSGMLPPVDEAINEAVDRLNKSYEAQNHAFMIQRWAGGFRMVSRPEVAHYLKTHFEDKASQRLSKSLLETVSIMAYRQPITKPEADFIRGVDTGYAIRKLLERNLIKIAGRSEAVGKPLLYATTDFFLDQCGLNGLDELPRPREIEELLKDPAFRKERDELATLTAMEEVDAESDATAVDVQQKNQSETDIITEQVTDNDTD